MAINIQDVCQDVQWIDVLDPTQAEMDSLATTYKLNPFTVRDCLQPEHLPKYEIVEDVHFLILRFYSHTFDRQVSTIQELTNKIAIFLR